MAGKNQNSNGTKKSGSLADNLLDMLQPDKVMNNAQKVISSAVNILEEEIAAGIHAAKRIEKKFLDTEGTQNNPEDLMSRIRRDTHEAIDIFLDAFAALSKQVGVLGETLTKQNEQKTAETTTTATTNNTTTASGFSVITADAPVKAGATTILWMQISETIKTKTVAVQLYKTDLTGGDGKKILARNIRLQPAAFQLEAGKSKEVKIEVKVPANTKAGFYNALLTGTAGSRIKTVIEIEVIE